MRSPSLPRSFSLMLSLALRYAGFAAVATVVNLFTQRLVLGLNEGSLGFPLAVLAGTVVGLIVKYILDKKWIFFDQESGLATHTRKFALYTAMGVVTTLIFWGGETTFWLVWGTQEARELGAVVSLTIGYFLKYHLDRRLVFAPRQDGGI